MTVAANTLGYYAGESAPLTNKQTSNDKEKRHEAKVLAALRRVRPDGCGAPWRFSLLILKSLCRV